MVVTGPEPKQVEDGRVVQLCHRGEPAEFPGVLHEGEIPLDKGEDAGGEIHRREGGFVWSDILSRSAGSKERGVEESNQ